MKNVSFAALALVPTLVACGSAQESAEVAATAAPGRFAIVKACKGVMNADWLEPGTNKPAKGELDITVITKPGTKTITGLAVRALIPGHQMKGSDEYIHSGLYEIKDASVASLKVTKVRGSFVTAIKAAAGQKILSSTEGSTEAHPLVGVEFRNGDGASFVDLKLSMILPGVAGTFSQTLTFQGCDLQNVALLQANSK